MGIASGHGATLLLSHFFIAGDIKHVKMKLDKQHNTRIAFIEFKTNDAAKTALGMCGAQLGSSQIRVSPSKTPVRVQPT
jgi:RNA recognition motif-containing protein